MNTAEAVDVEVETFEPVGVAANRVVAHAAQRMPQPHPVVQTPMADRKSVV